MYTAVFHIPIASVVYFNLKVLFPLFWEKQKYFFYSLSVLVLTAVGAGFYLLLFDRWIDYIFTGYYFIAFYSFWDISLYFAIYLLLTSLLRLARGWFKVQELEKEKSKAELKALKSQINPHFLFNSLNSIYSLARKKSEEVPDKIIQLSDLMRHMLYGSEMDFIPLKKELEMIRNYIDLQNLRSGDEQKILFNVRGDFQHKKIAPFMLLPFVENSFKHGIKGGADKAFVSIDINITPNNLIFSIENSKGENKALISERNKGIGLNNIKKRLKLVYPDAHELKIQDNKETFKVLLQVKLK
jgi:LytS/YehU family sensor histidine kinase